MRLDEKWDPRTAKHTITIEFTDMEVRSGSTRFTGSKIRQSDKLFFLAKLAQELELKDLAVEPPRRPILGVEPEILKPEPLITTTIKPEPIYTPITGTTDSTWTGKVRWSTYDDTTDTLKWVDSGTSSDFVVSDRTYTIPESPMDAFEAGKKAGESLKRFKEFVDAMGADSKGRVATEKAAKSAKTDDFAPVPAMKTSEKAKKWHEQDFPEDYEEVSCW